MKNLFFSIFSAVALVLAQTPTAESQTAGCRTITRDIGSLVNVRYYPTVTAPIMFQVRDGASLTPVAQGFGRDADGSIWVAIRYGGELGFIRSDFLSRECFNVPFVR